METIAKGRISEVICIGFVRGDLFLEGIRHAIKQHAIEHGVILSGFGTFSTTRMHFTTNPGLPPHDEFVEIRDTAIELVSVHGLIVEGQPHVHMTVGDMERTWAGHLEDGCVVLYLAELAIGRLENMPLRRVETEYGIKNLHGATGI